MCLVELDYPGLSDYPGLDGYEERRGLVLCAVVRQGSLADARWLLRQPPYKEFQLTPSVLAAAAASTTPDARAKLEWLLDEERCPAGPEAAAAAARRGDMDTLRWLEQRGCRAPAGLLVEAAAEGGGLGMMKSLLGGKALDPHAYRRACKAAAASSQLPALRLLLSRGTPAIAGQEPQDARRSLLGDCVLGAVAGNQLEALQLLWDEFGARLPEGDWDVSLNGDWRSPQPVPHVGTLRWLWQRTDGQLGEGVAQRMFGSAAYEWCLPVMAFLYEEAGMQQLDMLGDALVSGLDTAAVTAGETLAALDWLHARGCRLPAENEWLLGTIIERERLELLEWLHAHGYRLQLSRERFLFLLSQGSLELAEWFHERGLLPPRVLSGDDVMVEAVRGGNVQLTKWLADRGCSLAPSCYRGCSQFAADEGNLEMMDYVWWLMARHMWRPLVAVVLAICLAVALGMQRRG